MNTNIQELLEFNNACDELLSGKYLLIDVKINSILKSIENDVKIKDIVSTCVNSFNFSDLLNSASVNNNVCQLEDNKQHIALVYNFLFRLKNKEIDFYNFLSTYFPNEEGTDNQYACFISNLIIPFKQAIGEVFINKHVIVESQDYQNNYYNKIKTTIQLILSEINNLKLGINDKDEFEMLLNSLYIASDKNDKNLVYSLMIGLDYFTKHHKKIRKTYLALEECFY